MQKKENALCFSGHRSERLPKSKENLENLKLKIEEEIDRTIKNGTYTFILERVMDLIYCVQKLCLCENK